MKDLDRKIALGAAWMVGFKLIDRSIGLLSTIVLARVLAPEDFGLVAMAMVLIGALELFIAFSFDVVLIQNPSAGRAQFDTAWTLNAVFTSACALVLALLAGGAASFYGQARLEPAVVLVLQQRLQLRFPRDARCLGHADRVQLSQRGRT